MPNRLETTGIALRWVGAVLVLFLGFGLVLFGLPHFGLAAILLGALVGTLGAALEAGGRRLSWRIVLLPPLYLLLYLYDAVAILFGLPFILMAIVLGPMAMLVGLVALAMLGIWATEKLFGDIRGVSSFENGTQALAGFGVLLLSVGALVLYGRMGEDGPLDLAARLLRRFHDFLQRAATGLLEEHVKAAPPEDDPS